MPNWCFNSMKIPASKKDLVFNEEGQVDFKILLPMPESLNVPSGSLNDYAIYMYLSERRTKSVEEVRDMPESKLIANHFSKDWLADIEGRMDGMLANKHLYDGNTTGEPKDPVEFLYERGKILVDNHKTYGATTWYEWAWANWGTKWNAGDCEIEYEDEDYIKFRFDTAWGPADGWLTELSKHTPFVITFEVENEPGIWGLVSKKKGEVAEVTLVGEEAYIQHFEDGEEFDYDEPELTPIKEWESGSKEKKAEKEM